MRSVSTCILLLFCLFGTSTVSGGLIEFKLTKHGKASSSGAVPSVQQGQVGDIDTSRAHEFREGNGFPMILQTAAGFDPNGPCSTTNPFDSGNDIRQLENQVTVATL
jgi:hypothetical protein